VTAIFAGLYLDDIAGGGKALSTSEKACLSGKRHSDSLQFALAILLVNIDVVWSYGHWRLAPHCCQRLSPEPRIFEMIAMRHMPVDEARLLRRENTPRVFAAGFIPALLSIIPLINLVVPLFATSYFMHIFKQVRATSG
jgi:CysZ protein